MLLLVSFDHFAQRECELLQCSAITVKHIHVQILALFLGGVSKLMHTLLGNDASQYVCRDKARAFLVNCCSPPANWHSKIIDKFAQSSTSSFEAESMVSHSDTLGQTLA